MTTVAAGALLAIIIYLGWPATGPAGRIQAVAAEVALNHIKSKPVDIASASLDELRQFFTQLDFVPVQSRLLPVEAWHLTGGRYCSIQGRTAAQLRMRRSGSTGTVQTLYQAVYDKERHGALPRLEAGDQPLVTYARGVKVVLWVERGLLFALAGDY